MSDHDRITILLSRRLAGELTPAEKEELRLALEQDPILQALSSALDGVKDAPPEGVTEREERQMMERGLRQWRLRAAGLHVVSRGAEEVAGMGGDEGMREGAVEREGRGRGIRIRLIRWPAAAAVVVLGTLGILRYNNKMTPPPPHAQAPVAWHEVAAKYGTRSYLDLPDGSKLWLNAGSKVQYASGKRELTLSGEGFFDIRHDPEHPFLIHAGNVVVKVLGTSLNVRAYPGDSVVETTLIDGKAEVDMPGRAIALRPSEKVTMHNGVQQVRKVVADPTYKTIIETSWVEDKLIFRREPFREVAAKLERWYNIRIHFENDKYQDEELTGYFKDQPIKNVMDALQLSLGFHYELTGDSIRIK